MFLCQCQTPTCRRVGNSRINRSLTICWLSRASTHNPGGPGDLGPCYNMGWALQRLGRQSFGPLAYLVFLIILRRFSAYLKSTNTEHKIIACNLWRLSLNVGLDEGFHPLNLPYSRWIYAITSKKRRSISSQRSLCANRHHSSPTWRPSLCIHDIFIIYVVVWLFFCAIQHAYRVHNHCGRSF